MLINLAHNVGGFQVTSRSLDEMPLREVTLWNLAFKVWSARASNKTKDDKDKK